ncbi:unnamed protein product [Dovyalis caffra]|uniref:Uncharacterized protein n=1 Tax=Dovyalis caffra TaxID=77055 RepID=A0AAV1R6B3_9ROSI|nr:unnamed protein product [Dovyalis caffra]
MAGDIEPWLMVFDLNELRKWSVEEVRRVLWWSSELGFVKVSNIEFGEVCFAKREQAVRWLCGSVQSGHLVRDKMMEELWVYEWSLVTN